MRSWNDLRSMSEIQTIGITNQKGGVAKSTNTINLAGALAYRGNRVLAADLDPQGYLTNKLNLRDAYKADPPSLFDAMKEPTEHDVNDLTVEHAEFDVLPGNIDMFRLGQDLIASGWRPRERLQMLFDDLEGYDFVLVDAPPSLGPINDNVLLACGDIIVPVEAEDTSILALDHLLTQIETLEKRYEVTVSERGVIISNVNYPLDNEQREMIRWFEDTFDDRCPVYEVRHRAAIKRAMNAGGSIFAPDAEECDMIEVYDRIAADLEESHE
jgi:chromosome partitioning protein